jgi:hypothetical protein
MIIDSPNIVDNEEENERIVGTNILEQELEYNEENNTIPITEAGVFAGDYSSESNTYSSEPLSQTYNSRSSTQQNEEDDFQATSSFNDSRHDKRFSVFLTIGLLIVVGASVYTLPHLSEIMEKPSRQSFIMQLKK